jgi:hypothetical protein
MNQKENEQLYAKKKEKCCHPSRWQQLADVQYVNLSSGLVYLSGFSFLHYTAPAAGVNMSS